jgi:hypothetical protein
MPVEKITRSEYVARLQEGILDRSSEYDVTTGEIPDLCIYPQATVLESSHEDLRKVSLLISLQNIEEFEGDFEIDLERFVFNEGITRSLGAVGTTTVTFSRSAAPAADIKVQRGFPIATVADESTGQAVTFVTTEEKTMLYAQASSYYNIETERYELTVPVAALSEGASGQVAANRVTRPLRTLVEFDSVTNSSATVGARDQETNTELAERYLLAIVGRELATPNGAKKVTEDDFAEVSDVTVVYGSDELLTRAADDAGAVDAYVIGDEILEITENPTYLGTNQLIAVDQPPINEVLSVQDLSGPTTFVEDDDYEVVLDTTGNQGSTRAIEGIRFLPTGTLVLASPPTLGSPVTIAYTYNNLVRRLQTEAETADRDVFGQDLLYKRSTQIDIAHEALLYLTTGAVSATVLAAARSAVLTFINALRGGDNVEESDIQAEVRQITGVDNYVITRNTRTTVTAGTSDIEIERDEHARLATTDLVITVV